MLNCVPFSLLVRDNYNRVWGFSLLLRGNVIIGFSLLLREMWIRLGCLPWLRGIVITGCSLLWREICKRVSLLLRVVNIFSLCLRVANRSQWIQAITFYSLLWIGMGGKCCTFGFPISATEGVFHSSKEY